MTSTITQDEPAELAEATRTLTAVLTGPLDIDDRLHIAGAVAVLNDVHPPYPPFVDDLDPLDRELGVAAAESALRRALRTADIPSRVRIGLALRELADLRS